MNKLKFLFFVIFVMCLFSACTSNEEKEEGTYPLPDGIFDYEAFENDTTAKKYKKEYKEHLYYAENDLNVDSIRQLHADEHFQKSKRQARGLATFANGKIEGQWHERGPINEAGDLREVDFDPNTNELYVLSTAGCIYKGTLDGSSWVVLNDKLKFDTNILRYIKKNTTQRLIAVYGDGKENKIPRYSDDQGQNWTLASGIGSGFYDHYGSPRKMIKMDDAKSLYYLVYTWKGSPWGSAIELYKSIDYGQSYSLVVSLNGGGYDENEVDIWKPVGENRIYLLDNKASKFYTITHNNSDGSHILSSAQTINNLPSSAQTKLTGKMIGSTPTFYALVNKNTMYKCTDGVGVNWTLVSTVTINGANKNLFRNVFEANPLNDQIYVGGFQLYKTSDETNWTEQYSYWWTYYDKGIPLSQRKDNLHVDMMSMEFFRKTDGTPFYIILNHAGIYVSYDNLNTTRNLGLEGLNIVTLYDHATAPDGSIFFGAQDKGTFRSLNDINSNTATISTENMTTGDGMRELFFNSGQSWFGFLQNGIMYCKWDKNGSTDKTWQVPGDNIPGWINPIENHPDPAAKKCYVAGGNINGGAGSYLILMEVSWIGNGSSFQWKPTQFNYDFRANSKNGTSVIKALSACKSDYNRLYVATQDASFFYSSNGGVNWARSIYNLPTGLNPWDIVVSETNADKLYICGTGWSNTGVYESKDGGKNFIALNTNAPLATYFDLVLSSDEKFLFAATSEGPYVYVFEDNSWYDLSEGQAPLVDFRSVEFIASINTVRFGTYGRGLWDFQIIPTDVTGISSTSKSESFTLYPNPSTEDFFTLNLVVNGQVRITDSKGKLIHSENLKKGVSKIACATWGKGVYFVTLTNSANTQTQKILVR